MNQHTNKRFCKRGHEFSPENTRHYLNDFGKPFRRCATCDNERERRKRREQREQRLCQTQDSFKASAQVPTQ